MKCALAPKSDSVTSIPTGKRRPDQKYRKRFHGYAAHFWFLTGWVCFLTYSQLWLWAVYKSRHPIPSSEWKWVVLYEPGLHLPGMLGLGLGHQEEAPCEPLSAVRDGKAPPWQLPGPLQEGGDGSQLGLWASAVISNLSARGELLPFNSHVSGTAWAWSEEQQPRWHQTPHQWCYLMKKSHCNSWRQPSKAWANQKAGFILPN